MKLYYCIKVIEDIVVSQTPASANAHISLDYIPGSAVLGAIAAQAYNKLEDKSWDIFHSGNVIFSNAYVASQNDTGISRSYPTPLSWHVPKGKYLYEDNKLNKDLKNHAHKEYKRNDEIQEKQCRTGYISADKQRVSVSLSSATKTAINPATQTVEESQLFSYNFIEQDQLLVGYIDADQETIDVVKPFLESINRIGRSRNSEFGEVIIHILGNSEQPQILEDVKKDEKITIWLTSDCQIIDENGFPCLSPSAECLMFDNTKLELAHSFINTRNITLFNRKRQRFDSSQILLKKGSVLVYIAKDDISKQTLNNFQEKGIGINKQLGLGEIIINPEWSKHVENGSNGFFNAENFEYSCQQQTIINKPETSLCNWINEKIESYSSQTEKNNLANKAFINTIKLYQAGRKFNSVDDRYSAGPNKTQWGLLYQLYRSEETADRQSKFDEITEVKATDVLNWDLEFMKPGITNFSKEFKSVFLELNDNQTQLLLLEKLKSYELETLGVEDLGKIIDQVKGENS